MKIPITFHHDKYFSSNIDQYANVSYNIYIENLMDSLFTINFPRSTSHSFSQFQIKGRYWEALATGTTIIEEFNPLLNYFDYSPKIYNYNLLNDIVTYLHTQLDIGINNLYDDKISSYLNNKHLFEPDNFFDQFY